MIEKRELKPLDSLLDSVLVQIHKSEKSQEKKKDPAKKRPKEKSANKAD